jgi:hypothetical protein
MSEALSAGLSKIGRRAPLWQAGSCSAPASNGAEHRSKKNCEHVPRLMSDAALSVRGRIILAIRRIESLLHPETKNQVMTQLKRQLLP